MGSEWETRKWGELATLEYGKSIKGYKDREVGFRVYGTNGPIGWHTSFLFDKPTVIVGRKGAYRGIHFASEPFFVIDTAFYLKPKCEFDTKWAYYQLLTKDINGMDSGSAIPSTSRDDFYNIDVEIPPTAEQRVIAHILGTLDDKIELNRRMNETLESMARALFKSWFVDFDPVIDNALAAGNPIPEPLQARAETRRALGSQRKPLPENTQKLFPDAFVFDEEMGWIPEGWEVSDVGTEFCVTMGQSPPGHTYNKEAEGTPFFQGSTDFGFRFPTKRVYCTAPKRMAQIDDTLVSVRAPVGDINMAFDTCCVGRGLAAVRHKSSSRSFTYYSMMQLRESFRVYESEGTVFGSINQKGFKALRQIDYPIGLISEFDRLVNDIDEKVERNSRSINSLTKLRDTLLPKLLSGELRVPEAMAAAEEALS